MSEERLTPVEVHAMRIIAHATQHQMADVVLFGRLCVFAHGLRQQGYGDDYQAVLRVIGYLLKELENKG